MDGPGFRAQRRCGKTSRPWGLPTAPERCSWALPGLLGGSGGLRDEQKPQLLVIIGVHGPAALSAAESSSAPSCPAASSVLLFAEGGNISHPSNVSLTPHLVGSTCRYSKQQLWISRCSNETWSFSVSLDECSGGSRSLNVCVTHKD